MEILPLRKNMANNAADTLPTDENREHFPAPAYDKDEKWVKEHIEQFGEEPSFF